MYRTVPKHESSLRRQLCELISSLTRCPNVHYFHMVKASSEEMPHKTKINHIIPFMMDFLNCKKEDFSTLKPAQMLFTEKTSKSNKLQRSAYLPSIKKDKNTTFPHIDRFLKSDDFFLDINLGIRESVSASNTLKFTITMSSKRQLN